MEEEKIKDLMHRIAHQDQAAFDEFYDAHIGLLYSTIYRVLNNHEDTQDVLQEVSTQIWLKANLYNPSKGKPLTWVTTMAKNRAIDRIRSKKRRYQLHDTFEKRLEGSERIAENGALAQLDRQDTSTSMHKAIIKLSQEQRQAIELTYLQGLTQNEAARKLDLPVATIKARIRRGILKLRGMLPKEAKELATPRTSFIYQMPMIGEF